VGPSKNSWPLRVLSHLHGKVDPYPKSCPPAQQTETVCIGFDTSAWTRQDSLKKSALKNLARKISVYSFQES
jgi:hypothetical protein